MEILSSTKYDKFKLDERNRPIDARHLVELKHSIEQKNMLRANPIMVTEDMEIIDGQHRFMICKEFGLPVYYVIVEDSSIDDAALLNRKQRNWYVQDYLNFYARKGVKGYQELEKLAEDYPKLSLSTIIRLTDSGREAGNFIRFREGKYEEMDSELAHFLLDCLSDMAEIDRSWGTGVIARAWKNIFMSPNYDHAKMLRKIKMYPHPMKAFVHREDFMRQMEDVYNWKTSAGTVRLF